MTCSVDECDRGHYAKGYCQLHYQRLKRTDELGPTTSKLMSRAGNCAECSHPVWARGLCNVHYTRWNKHGNVDTVLIGGCCLRGPNHPNWKGTEITYHSAHHRLRRTRGPAKAQLCVDCGGGAQQWSYNGTADGDELTSEMGDYSPDPQHYDPRCIPCHKKFDLHIRKETR